MDWTDLKINSFFPLRKIIFLTFFQNCFNTEKSLSPLFSARVMNVVKESITALWVIVWMSYCFSSLVSIVILVFSHHFLDHVVVRQKTDRFLLPRRYRSTLLSRSSCFHNQYFLRHFFQREQQSSTCIIKINTHRRLFHEQKITLLLTFVQAFARENNHIFWINLLLTFNRAAVLRQTVTRRALFTLRFNNMKNILTYGMQE